MEVVLSPVSAFSHSPGVWSHLTPHIWCGNTPLGAGRRGESGGRASGTEQLHPLVGILKFQVLPAVDVPLTDTQFCGAGDRPMAVPWTPSLAIAMRALIPLSSLPEPHFRTQWCLAGGEWGAGLTHGQSWGVWLWHPVGRSPLTGCMASYPSMFCFIP